jgi:RNA polymerase sigma-70 factor (ECF subfamily)
MWTFRTAIGSLSDPALLARYAKGDNAAARELARRLLPRLMGVAQRMLSDVAEAEDVVQETMLRLWKIAPDWQEGEAQVSTWAYRVAMNLCTDRLRKRRFVSDTPLDAMPDPADASQDVEDRMQDDARARALHHAIADLPERQRAAMVLRHFEGLSNPEIAAIMDIGVEAVESLTSRGRRTLKKALADRREELGYGHG